MLRADLQHCQPPLTHPRRHEVADTAAARGHTCVYVCACVCDSFKCKKLELDINKKNLINKIYELLSNNNKYIDTNYNYKMVLKINYKRSYFISDQGEFRATIDTEINTSPVLDFNKVIRLPETILEFKFSKNSESYFRDFFSLRGLNIRSKKYSKYIQSFIALEESGFII